MKISKEEIEDVANDCSSNYEKPFDLAYRTGFIAGAEYLYQQLEPVITDLSMERARRQSDHFKQVTAYTDNTPVTASSCSMIAPQSEVMTLEECKDLITKKTCGIDRWVDFIGSPYWNRYQHNVNDEAAELYANQKIDAALDILEKSNDTEIYISDYEKIKSLKKL